VDRERLFSLFLSLSIDLSPSALPLSSDFDSTLGLSFDVGLRKIRPFLNKVLE
jgi:hypothetical protein